MYEGPSTLRSEPMASPHGRCKQVNVRRSDTVNVASVAKCCLRYQRLVLDLQCSVELKRRLLHSSSWRLLAMRMVPFCILHK